MRSQVDSASNILLRDPPGWLDLGKDILRLGRRGMSEMQTAPQPRESRIKAGKIIIRARAAQGENPLFLHAMGSRRDMDTIYCLNYVVKVE